MSIISTQMSSSIKNGSWIRRMFEAGIQLKQKYGDDAVCDFSLGNPDLAPPPAVGKALAEFVKHVDEPFSLGYMPNNGFGWAREKLAAHLSKEQGAELTANDVILTCGAAGALNVIFRTVLEPGDEVLTVTPYSWNTAPMWATTAVRSRRSRPCRVPSGLICPPLRRSSRPRPAP